MNKINIPGKELIVIAIVISLGFALRLVVVLQPLEFISDNGPLIDDSFISLTIARNMSLGFGSTFDRVIETNGYQPLWVFLLVPLFWSFNGSAPTAALLLSLLVSTLTGLLIYRVLRLWGGAMAGIIGLVIWMFNPLVLRHSLNGLETGLYSFLLMVLLNFLLNDTSGEGKKGFNGPGFFYLWLLAGMIILCRVDALFLVPGLGYLCFRTRGIRDTLIGLVMAGAPILIWTLLVSPVHGSVFPDSGRAVRLISLCYGERFSLLKDISLSPDHIPWQYFVSNLAFSLTILEKYVLYIFSPFVAPFSLIRDPVRPFLVFPGFIMLVAGVVLLVWRTILRATPTRSLFSSPLFVVFGTYTVLLVTAYSTWSFGQWFYHRYYFPLFLFGILAISLVTSHCVSRMTNKRWSTLVIVILSYWLAMNYAISETAYLAEKETPTGYTSVASLLKQETNPGDTVGCFQAGTIGYLLPDRRVICLDGVVNHRAYEALKKKTMAQYIESENISLVVDWDWIVQSLLHSRSGSDLGDSGSWRSLENLPDPFVGIKKREEE